MQGILRIEQQYFFLDIFPSEKAKICGIKKRKEKANKNNSNNFLNSRWSNKIVKLIIFSQIFSSKHICLLKLIPLSRYLFNFG